MMDGGQGASGSRFESRTRGLTHMVWLTDAEGRFAAQQPTWTAYTGQAEDEPLGQGWQSAVHPDDLELVWRRWRAAREQRALFVAEVRLWHGPTEQFRQCEIRAVPDVGADGGLRGWVGICVDVHDRRSAEQALRIADRRKDEFMGVLAHELRNPLAPIRNAVHVLKMCREDDARSAWARNIIERQVDQMARLLDDLLDLTRIARGKLEVRRDRLDLAEAIERAIETSRPLLDAQGHVFEAELPAAPMLVDGDGPRLAQVFANLLNNAAKYTDRGGRIRLAAAVHEGQAVVRVRDNGMGIDAAVLPNLFRLYAQAMPARERAQGGLGIGLALVRGLVEMHGGSVGAASDGPGCGTEITVRLPLLQAEVMPAPRPAPQLALAPSMRILIADDNHDAAQTLAVLLEVLGHEVRIASDGQEAVELAGSTQPAVALLDIGMPRLDGYAAARRIRELLPRTVLIATTGWCRTEDLRRAAEAGFDHHLVKPVDPEQVMRLIAVAALQAAVPVA